MSTDYIIRLNSEQLSTVIAALDIYSRIGSLHLDAVGEQVLSQHGYEHMDEVRATMKRLKGLFGMHPNQHLGVGSPAPRLANLAYDIQCVLRREQARAEEHAPHSVWHYEPMHYVKEVPLATCEAVK